MSTRATNPFSPPPIGAFSAASQPQAGIELQPLPARQACASATYRMADAAASQNDAKGGLGVRTLRVPVAADAFTPTLSYGGRISPAPSAASQLSWPAPFLLNGAPPPYPELNAQPVIFAEDAAAAVQFAERRRKKVRLAMGVAILAVLGTSGGILVGAALGAGHHDQARGPDPLAVPLGLYNVLGANVRASCDQAGLQLCTPVLGGAWRIGRAADVNAGSYASARRGYTLRDGTDSKTYSLRAADGGAFLLEVLGLRDSDGSGCELALDMRARLAFATQGSRDRLTGNATSYISRVDASCTPTQGAWPRDTDVCQCGYTLAGERDAHADTKSISSRDA